MASRKARREATSPFDEIVPDLYDAVLQAGSWSAVLSRVADAAGVGAVHFVFSDAIGRPIASEKTK